MKIAVIGHAGSGKSTLARWLSQRHQIPVLYLDTIYWLPGWNIRDKEERMGVLKAFMDDHEGWVIDGTYKTHLFDRRMEEADRIVFLNFNRFNCFYRALKRHVQWKGRSRDSITAGCEEKFDLEFAKWILWKGRDKAAWVPFRRVLEQYPEKVVVLKNQREMDAFMAAYPPNPSDTL